MAIVERISSRLDSWRNALTGLGGSKDKRQYTEFVRNSVLTDSVLEDLYHQDDLAAIVCDAFPEAALRQGFGLHIEEDTDEDSRTDALEPGELKSLVLARSEELELGKHVLDAAIWGNVFGGACILLGADDGRNVALPLKPESVRAVRYLTVLDKRDLTIRTWYNDPLQPNFGKPETFSFVNFLGAESKSLSSGQLIHESRLVFFHGARTSKRRQRENAGWSYSKLQKVYEVLREFGVGWSSAGYLLGEASQAVYGVKGLLDILGSKDGANQLQKRMQLIDMSRSVAKALVIDAEGETFERKPTSFSGVPELLDRFCNRLSAATRIPVTILFGQAPAGLQATGASDIRAFYDQVKSYQNDTIGPAMEYILRLLIIEQNAGKEPGSWKVTFPSLYQMTEPEQAAYRKTIAETDVAYINAQVLTPEEVALNRWPADGYSAEMQVDLSLREEIQEIEAENQIAEKEKPAPPPGEEAGGVEAEQTEAPVPAQ